VNNRLGLNVIGTLNLQGGRLAINAGSTTATPVTELVTTFNVTNGGGRIELTPDAVNPVTLTVTTLNTANGNGALVVGGIDGSVAGTAGKAALVITTPNLISGQGGGANGSTTMSVRHDILGDASVSGLGTGFLVRDTAVGGTYRALASGELASAFALPLTTDVDLVTAGNQAAGALNVGLTGSAATIGVNTVANTLTISGTSSIGSSLGAAFGNYGPGGNLLTTSLSNAAASLTLAGATGTINTAFGSTTTGTTPFAHVIAGGTLNVNGAFGFSNAGTTGTAGLEKADGGTMNLNNRAYYTGATTVNNGTLNLNSSTANTIAVVPTAGAATVSQLNLNGTSATVNLNGQSQAFGALTSVNPLPGMGGTLTNTGAAATVSLNPAAASVFGGSITGAIALTRSGAQTTTLTNANTYTGATIVRGGTLQLRDSGTISSTAGLTLNYGTLNWDNFGLNAAGTPNPTRIAATNPVTLQGGTFTINGAGSTDTVLTLNSVTVTGGNNVINVLPYINEGSTVKLTIGNLVRNVNNRSGVVFNGFTTNNSTGASTLGGQGLTQNGNIILNQINGTNFTASNLVNNLIGGWAVADGSTFATYVNGFGVSVMGQTTQGIVAPGFTGTDVSAALVATGNYNDGSNRTLAAGAVTANSLRFGPGANQTITFPATTTLSLGTGIITNAGFSTTLAATDASNTLTGTGTDLYFYINQNTVAVQPAIVGTASLVSNGPATLSLRPTFASNTYSGGTFVNAGTLNLQAGGAFTVIPGDLTINNAAVTMSTAQVNQIAATSNVFINGGGSLTFPNYSTGPTQTLASLTFTNDGGTGNPSLTLGTPTVATSTLILSSATPITSTNNSLATTPTISTGAAALTALQFSNANPVLTVNDGLAETELTISAPITQNASMTSLSKTGTGVLALSGQSTFTTGFDLNQGGLMFGAGSTGSPTITSGPVGTGTLTIAGSTSLLSDGTVRTILNPTTVNGNFAFAGPVAGNGVILSGAMNLGATGRTITVDSPANTSTISGAITSTATGTALTKAGAGILVLSSATSNLAGAGVAVTGGILRNGITNAVPAASPVTVSAGAGYDLNGFSQTSDTLTGPGFVTNSANTAQTLTLGGASVSSTLDTTLTDNILAQSASRLNLTKVGTGTLTISGANSHSGTTTASAGMISITNAAALGTVTGGTVVSSGGSLELSNNITVGAEALTIAGTGSATNGALRNLSGNNTYGGTVTIGTGGATITSDAGLLTLNNATAAIAATTLPVTLAGAGNIAVTTPITGTTATLTKSGAGTATLSGTNTYAGQTAINGGILSVAASANLGNASATNTLAMNGGTLQTTASFDLGTNRTLALGVGGGTLDVAASTAVTLPAAISGTGGLTKAGAGTLELDGTAANTFSGLTTVSAGVLRLNKTPGTNAIVGDSVSEKVTPDVLINGGTLLLVGNNQLDDSVFINMTSGVFNVNGRTETIYWFANSGGTYLSPRGSALTVIDPTWSGGNNDLFGNDTYGNLIIAGGTNIIHGAEGFGVGQNASLTVGSGGLEFQGVNNNLTLSSDDQSAGVLNLNGNVSFTGSAGTATITSGQALQADGVTPAVVQPGANQGTVNLGASTRTFTIANGSAATDMSISARIIGTGGLTKDGAGLMALSGANTYTGTTAINGGTLNVGSVETAGVSGPLGVPATPENSISFGGGTLQYSAANQFDYSSRFSTAASQAVSIDTNGQNVTHATNLSSASGTVAKSGAGTLTFTAVNTYSGATTITGGALQIGTASITTASIATTGTTVSATGTLAGTGSVAGLTVVQSGGFIAPGDSAGATNNTLTLTANSATALTVNNGGQIQLGVTNATLTSTGFQTYWSGGSSVNALDYLTNVATGDVALWNVAPGTITDHDRINLTGTGSNLSIGNRSGGTYGLGSVLVSGTVTSPTLGMVFNLIDWMALASFNGTFTNGVGPNGIYDATSTVSAGDLDLPSLSAGFGWDTSAFQSYGVLVIVPEPSRLMLLFFGLFGLFFRRRRNG
jgi:autotransporter-associated beta strand protein